MSAPGLGSTIGSARRALASALRAGGCDSPDLDARLLVGLALALDHAALAAMADRALTAADAERIAALAQRRLAGEPVARIRGSKEFWGLELTVTGAVLVPRPETETVVEAALACVEAQASARSLRLVDLGTGCGALLLALLYELPNATGIGTDRSVDALAVARGNASRHGLARRAHFVACDYGSALAGGSDVVVANPPYIATNEIAALSADVRNYDPALALDGGPDGLNAYRSIAADARRLLRRGGTMIAEIGPGQAERVAQIMRENGLNVTTPIRADLGGVPRALVANH
jgi:release factor glutamine methyltransferase